MCFHVIQSYIRTPLVRDRILHVEVENISVRLKCENSRIVFNFLVKLSHVNLRRRSLCFILEAFIQNFRRNIIEYLELSNIHTLANIFSQFIVLGQE